MLNRRSFLKTSTNLGLAMISLRSTPAFAITQVSDQPKPRTLLLTSNNVFSNSFIDGFNQRPHVRNMVIQPYKLFTHKGYRLPLKELGINQVSGLLTWSDWELFDIAVMHKRKVVQHKYLPSSKHLSNQFLLEQSKLLGQAFATNTIEQVTLNKDIYPIPYVSFIYNI